MVLFIFGKLQALVKTVQFQLFPFSLQLKLFRWWLKQIKKIFQIDMKLILEDVPSPVSGDGMGRQNGG